MIEVNLNQIKRRLYADGCTDLARHVVPALVASGGQELRRSGAALETEYARVVHQARSAYGAADARTLHAPKQEF